MNADLAVSLVGLNSQNVVGPLVSRLSDVNQKIDEEKAARIADINNIVSIHSTDTERLAAVTALTQAFEADDATILQTLTNAINSEESTRTSEDTALQNQITTNDDDILGNSQAISANVADIGTNEGAITTINAKLGSQTSTSLGVLTNQTVLLSTQFGGCIKTTGDETINGQKTWSEAASFSSTVAASSIIGSTTWGAAIIPAGKVDLSSRAPVSTTITTSQITDVGSGVVISAAERTLLATTHPALHTQHTSALATKAPVSTTVTSSQITDVGSGVVMSAAERTLLGTTHVALHTQHTSALATKAPVSTTVTSSQITDVGSGVVMSAAERTLLGTTHVALHTQHTSALATKAPVSTTVTSSQITDVGSGVVMSAAERTLLGTTHVALHTQHTSALATKAPVSTTVTSSQITDVGSGVVMSAAERTLLGTTHVALHTQHTSVLATKAPVSTTVTSSQITDVGSGVVMSAAERTLLGTLAPKASPVFTGTSTFSGAVNMSGGDLTLSNARKLILNNSGNGETPNAYADDIQVYKYNGAGITIGSPEGKINSLAFADQNHGNRNLIRAYSTVLDSRNIGMHCFSNQADTEVPSLSITDGFIGINKAQPTAALDCVGDVEISGNVNLAAGKAFKINGTAIDGVNESSDYDFTGNHSYDGAHIRITHHLDPDADYTYDADDAEQNLSKDISSYLFYRVPSTHTDSTKHFLFLPSDCPVGTRIGVRTFGKGYSNRNKVCVGCQSENDRLYSRAGASNLNGWRSGAKSSNSSHYVEIKSSDRKYFVCVYIDTTDSNSRWWIA